MPLSVYEWFSYSCNNSSDYRLVAEFASDAAAQKMAKELEAVLLENAEQAEEADSGDGDWDPHDLDPSPALVAFGKKYGTKFSEGLIWGDDGSFTEDLPSIATLGNKIYAYHSYMSGGFDGDLPRVLKKAGARKVETEQGAAWLKVTAHAKPKKAPALRDAIDAFTRQAMTKDNLCDWEVPWDDDDLPIERDLQNVVTLHDGDSSTFTLAIRAGGIAAMTKWLRKIGAESVDIAIVNEKELDKLRQSAHDAEQASVADEMAASESAAKLDPRGLTFLFTGKLASMTRDEAKARVSAIGGKSAGSVSKTLDVLVIGDDGSPLYGGGAKGDKQRKAEALVAAGAKIAIISESAFLQLDAGSSNAKAAGAKTASAKTASTKAAGAGDAKTPAADAKNFKVTAKGTPKVSIVTTPKDDWTLLSCSSCVAGDTLYFVGGRGSDFSLCTRDGKTFKEMTLEVGYGLRGITLDDREAWVVGEYGFVSRGANLQKLSKVATKTGNCMFTVARAADGEVWVGGDDGYLARAVRGNLQTVGGLKGAVSEFAVTSHGLFAATAEGLYRIASGKPVATSLKHPVSNLVETSTGALVVVGKRNAVFRSADGGAKFVKSKVPAFKKASVPAKNKRTKASWDSPKDGLLSAAVLPNGRVIVTGEQGALLYSDDDGASFKQLPQSFTQGMLQAAVAYRDAIYIAGDHGVILRVS